jgi:3-deoxy-D-manno-octulosonate 8-phosphate phosphatase (KDO 8-P phosphatase)
LKDILLDNEVFMIKYLVMDVDGTLTDGKIYMGNDGEVCKAFSAKDGYGIHEILVPSGIIPIIITGRSSKIVENRCREMGVTEIFQGIQNKVETLLNIVGNEGLSNVAYIGDDNNDLSCMKSIKNQGGLVGCPADAANDVRNISDLVCQAKGGEGAVREFIEWILKG